jgi:hypothetical protein
MVASGHDDRFRTRHPVGDMVPHLAMLPCGYGRKSGFMDDGTLGENHCLKKPLGVR